MRGWALADINIGILYHLRHLVAGRLRHHHGRLGVELEIRPSSARCASAAQMVSYEVSIGFVIITVLLLRRLAEPHRRRAGAGRRASPPCWAAAASFLDWYWLPLLPMFVIFYISALAETNRPPFDLVEASPGAASPGFMVGVCARRRT